MKERIKISGVSCIYYILGSVLMHIAMGLLGYDPIDNDGMFTAVSILWLFVVMFGYQIPATKQYEASLLDDKAEDDET